MRLSLRFIVPLILALACIAYAAVPLVDALTARWFMRDLDMRAQLIARTMEEPLGELLAQKVTGRINALFARAVRDERLFAVAFCDPQGRIAYRTPTLPGDLQCTPPPPSEDFMGYVRNLPKGALYVSHVPVSTGESSAGVLMLVHDMSFIQRRSADTRRYVLALFLVLGIVVSMITVLVAHLSWRGWISGVRSFLRGDGLLRPFGSGAAEPSPEVRPLIGDLRAVLREAGESRNLAEDITVQWTPGVLRQLLKSRFYGDEIIVASNREPYIHDVRGDGVVVRRPASGLVTAVEPVMRACSGTWVAHGSGTADRQFVDAVGRVRVPPEAPAYTLRRVWLGEEEERGYYYGFSNEGLWPLCHMAHVRPVFRRSDWEHYRTVNRRFAEAIIEEARTDNPVILVQDYHLALLPAIVRHALPRATILSFWHIPWPNPEAFGICPWREEILEGLLGSTIMGFHTRQHSRNFLETVDRLLEARIEHESSTISHGGRLTRVEAYPISIDWPDAVPSAGELSDRVRARVRARHGLSPGHLVGLGVDRLDYTKGIIERLSAIEALLERHPELQGRFSFIQIAAPSRSSLDEYQSFAEKVRLAADGINRRFARGGVDPVCLLVEHHEPDAVFEYYRACDVCVVTSLHDGMNLVAKEFVSAREDEHGALVLSQFAGASLELHEALIVNPYDVEQTADAVYRGLTMPEAEQRERLRALRARVRDFNVYRWAARMLIDAASVRERQRVSERIVTHGRARLRRAV